MVAESQKRLFDCYGDRGGSVYLSDENSCGKEKPITQVVAGIIHHIKFFSISTRLFVHYCVKQAFCL